MAQFLWLVGHLVHGIPNIENHVLLGVARSVFLKLIPSVFIEVLIPVISHMVGSTSYEG